MNGDRDFCLILIKINLMAYTDYTLMDLKIKFGLNNRQQNLFSEIEEKMPSERLLEQLQDAKELPVRSEKAKSEGIVFPILLELRKQNDKFFTIYSGDRLNANVEHGLVGECDFILAKDTNSFMINLPIITLVEAKKNDLEVGIPQCAAQMLGAKLYNAKFEQPIDTIFGCVTTATEWRFLKLENQEIIVDSELYFLNDLPKILGVFQTIIDFYKRILGE